MRNWTCRQNDLQDVASADTLGTVTADWRWPANRIDRSYYRPGWKRLTTETASGTGVTSVELASRNKNGQSPVVRAKPATQKLPSREYHPIVDRTAD